MITDNRSWRAVEVSERCADGLAKWNDLKEVHAQAERVEQELLQRYGEAASPGTELYYAIMPERSAARAAFYASTPQRGSKLLEVIGNMLQMAAGGVPDEDLRYRPERFCQSDLLRCIFDNLFRSVALDPSWLTPDVTALAQTIYDHRRFEDMPILADALEEAGCANEDILNHCRGEGLHARGCWVVDLLLGKNQEQQQENG